MNLLREKEISKDTLLAVILAVLAIVSLPFAYLTFTCHSYGRTPVRFIVDMILRALLIALPFYSAFCSYGLLKKREWAGRWVKCSILIISPILLCIFLEMMT